jgi:hypothetical protein
MIEKLVEKICYSIAFEKTFRGVYPRGYILTLPFEEGWNVDKAWEFCKAVTEVGLAQGLGTLAFVDKSAKVIVIYPDVPKCAEFLNAPWKN